LTNATDFSVLLDINAIDAGNVGGTRGDTP
jgi:hypothetical protein